MKKSEVVIEKLHELSEEIADKAIIIGKAKFSIDDNKDLMKEIEAQQLIEVNKLRDENNKPLFSNEATRQAELIIRLANSQAWNELKIKNRTIEENIIIDTELLNKLKREFAIYKLECELMRQDD